MKKFFLMLLGLFVLVTPLMASPLEEESTDVATSSHSVASKNSEEKETPKRNRLELFLELEKALELMDIDDYKWVIALDEIKNESLVNLEKILFYSPNFIFNRACIRDNTNEVFQLILKCPEERLKSISDLRSTFSNKSNQFWWQAFIELEKLSEPDFQKITPHLSFFFRDSMPSTAFASLIKALSCIDSKRLENLHEAKSTLLENQKIILGPKC